MKVYFQIAERSISYAKIKHSDYKHHEKSEKRTLKTSFFDINQGEIGKNLQKISISLSPSALFLRYLHPKKHKLHTGLPNTRDSEVKREKKGVLQLENIKKVSTKMKKVFMMVALVLACTTGSLANETCAESVTTSEMNSLPAKKSTKKKKATTKKKSTTTAKKTSSKSSTSTATTASTATTDSSKTHSADTVNTKASAVGVLAGLLGYAGGNSSNSTGSTTSKMGSIVGSILDNVIGSTTFKKADLCAHTWKYKSPGCAFTSENLLAKAGGEIAAKKVEEKLSTYYQKAGFSSSNTYFKFNEDGTFNAKIDGKSWSGTYTFDEKTHAIDLKGRLLLSLNGFATKNTSGISILFESKKLLTIIQTLTALSGNTTLGTIGEISKNYDGIRVGFDLSK